MQRDPGEDEPKETGGAGTSVPPFRREETKKSPLESKNMLF